VIIMFTTRSLKLESSNQDTIFGIVNSALSPHQQTFQIATSITHLNNKLICTKAFLIAEDRDC